MTNMEEYKEKFQKLFQETTKAIHILTDIQRECAEAYISSVIEESKGKNIEE